MNSDEKTQLLLRAKEWFTEVIAINHIQNTRKLINISEFNVNPFLSTYLANFLTGNSDPLSIAKALVYPRVLGTSITTSFGTNIQKFTTEVLSAFGSTTSGIDIEFIDCLDGQKKYCQLKAGPNTINKDDVETIAGHFKDVINLSRTNNLSLSFDNMIVGIIYGMENELSGHYNRITTQYHFPVKIGQDFWVRLTGDHNFYYELIKSISEVATESDFSNELKDVIEKLSQSEIIQSLSNNT
ncbi:MAG: PmeII family type II restriction endonuclease [Spirochaetia bacterium]|jgi:hypothetical protein|nr:PmeII family type II restriction endonuclease [Spirochaetia bacterium]